ncbi:MAG: nucleoside triphosphate pyrophosphohydrolase [Alphaproteobacteria bacterium]|nr:nucleoside triphosphate pyrophosphohydrolase [Alphaproteobacteria bacterium]
MATFVFNKLVRDLIPDMLGMKGHQVEVRPLNAGELEHALLAKLQEEVKELCEEKTQEGRLQELADVREVLDALMALWQIESSQVEKARLEKVERHGAFYKGVFVEVVKIDDDCLGDLAYLRSNANKYREIL